MQGKGNNGRFYASPAGAAANERTGMHPRSSEPELFDGVAPADDAYFIAPYGLFARQKIRAMVGRKLIVSGQSIEESQFQPASLDLRLAKEAYRVRASFLPGPGRAVLEHLESLKPERVSLTGEGAVLEKASSISLR